jgi:hypothetical protein
LHVKEIDRTLTRLFLWLNMNGIEQNTRTKQGLNDFWNWHLIRHDSSCPFCFPLFFFLQVHPLTWNFQVYSIQITKPSTLLSSQKSVDPDTVGSTRTTEHDLDKKIRFQEPSWLVAGAGDACFLHGWLVSNTRPSANFGQAPRKTRCHTSRKPSSQVPILYIRSPVTEKELICISTRQAS